MVYISDIAENDLFDILTGLFQWEKHTLTPDHIFNYVSDIEDICYSLDKKPIHSNAIYETHKIYGAKVYAYRRNVKTTWYIIYDLHSNGDVYVNKIISNYMTQS